MSNQHVMQTIRRTSCAVGLSLFLLCGARAAVVGSASNVDYTGGSVSFGYAGSDFTLSDNHTSPFDGSPVSITTRGSAEATSIGFPFYSQPTPNIYFLILCAATAYSLLTEPATTAHSRLQLSYPSPPQPPSLGWRKWMPTALTTAMGNSTARISFPTPLSRHQELVFKLAR